MNNLVERKKIYMLLRLTCSFSVKSCPVVFQVYWRNRHRRGQSLADFMCSLSCGFSELLKVSSSTCSPRHQAPLWLPEQVVDSWFRWKKTLLLFFNLGADKPWHGCIFSCLINCVAKNSEIACAFRYMLMVWVGVLEALENCCRVPYTGITDTVKPWRCLMVQNNT